MKRAPPNSAGAAAAAPGSGSSSRRSVAGGFSQVRIALSRGALKWSTPNAIFFFANPRLFFILFLSPFLLFFFRLLAAAAQASAVRFLYSERD